MPFSNTLNSFEIYLTSDSSSGSSTKFYVSIEDIFNSYYILEQYCSLLSHKNFH